MSRRDAILSAVGEAADLVRDFPVESRTSFDLFEVTESLDIPVMFRPLDGLMGAAVSVDDASGALVEEGLPRNVQRFTLAHELGHILLGHENEFDEEVGLSQRATGNSDKPVEETAADTFASELLAPRALLIRNINQQGWNHEDLQKPETIYQLSLRLGLSFPATCWALVEHDIIDYGLANEYSNRNEFPKSIKSSFVPDSIPRDPWSDVWLLTKGDAGNQLEASENDIFVVKLEEKSNSGYLWDFQEQEARFEILDEKLTHGEGYGSASSRVVFLKYNDPGIHSLEIQHKRPWNGKLLDEIRISIDNYGREDGGLPRRIRQKSLEEAIA